jgi:CheY-like chemotaxis protein
MPQRDNRLWHDERPGLLLALNHPFGSSRSSWLAVRETMPLLRFSRHWPMLEASALEHPRSMTILPVDPDPASGHESTQLEARALHALRLQIAAVAHDLNNVLTPNRLAADVLRRLHDERKRHTLLDAIVSSVNRAGELLQQMRQSTRDQADDLQTPPQERLPITGEAQAATSAAPALPAREQQVILVVEDDPAIRDLVRHVLKDTGYRVLTAANGAEAMARYRQQRNEVDAVVIDLMMPVMDGLTTIRALRQIAPCLPILPVSGLPPPAVVLEELSLRGFLRKPYTTSELLQAVQDLLPSPP